MAVKFNIAKLRGWEYESEVKKLSNSGYIPAPKALIGKKVLITVLEN